MARLIAWLLSQVLFWATLGVVFGPLLFVRGFRLLQRKRLIEDTPRSTVRGAALGPVELSGKAAGPYMLVAPLSQDDCLCYRIAVEPKTEGAKSKTTKCANSPFLCIRTMARAG
jgi:hypothetical protein